MRTLLISCLALLAACSRAPEESSQPAPSDASSPLAGAWRAVLDSPGGELPFTIVMSDPDAEPPAFAVSAGEHAPFSDVRVEGDEVTLEIAWYDARITAALAPDGASMTGRWSRAAAAGATASLPFSATRADERRFTDAPSPPGEHPMPDLSGDWQAVFTDGSGDSPAVARFAQQGSRVTGTFLTPTGDYRFLEGDVTDGVLRLSTFDGAHAFLFHARARPDGSLTGDFWSRDTYHATWTARPLPPGAPFELPDGDRMVQLTSEDGRLRFRFPDLSGALVSPEDPRFAGKVVLVEIFGTWCPNCADLAPFLTQWRDRYGPRGFEVIALAYEYSGDPQRDREMIRRYASRHSASYPILLAGVSDKRSAGESLPDLSGVAAYPTLVFIDRAGIARRVYSGFSGPAAGEAHTALIADLESTIESLLDEPAPR